MVLVLCKIYCSKCGKYLGTRTLQYNHACATQTAQNRVVSGSAGLRASSASTALGGALLKTASTKRFRGLMGLLLHRKG